MNVCNKDEIEREKLEKVFTDSEAKIIELESKILKKHIAFAIILIIVAIIGLVLSGFAIVPLLELFFYSQSN